MDEEENRIIKYHTDNIRKILNTVLGEIESAKAETRRIETYLTDIRITQLEKKR